ncbi:IclR family transcriptional regulator [Halopolyspora algeriensis]|uniref:Glycerol operon regulatory protein n=1 Tax=Halopolyspora algeriensis TaxID=1500506 RepID=A0A368VQE1_9ACTN|nr:IclR family transcriptional regulator C-terminal domain-containing protein [Halopolyspora algeriensis]RCW43708.1 IclR family transcriptional regulator [Halopolyspora algeriensis]TQM47509.1 IclR family transcriptional regulator [Halopolyspora algeriensis]
MVEERGEHFIQAVERALAVLRAFTPEHPELTLTEVATATGLDRAGARRLLLTLVDLGYLRHDGRHFTLTPQVLEFGYAYLSSRPLPQIAEPHLQRLTGELQETSSLAVLERDDICYIAQVPSPKLLSVTIPVGTRFPAHATSMGKVLLAGLPPELLEARLGVMELRPVTDRTITARDALRTELATVRKQGFVISDDELEGGLRGVAVPVRDQDGRVSAAVNVSLHSNGASESVVRKEVVPRLRTTASRIEADLRMKPTAPM